MTRMWVSTFRGVPKDKQYRPAEAAEAKPLSDKDREVLWAFLQRHPRPGVNR